MRKVSLGATLPGDVVSAVQSAISAGVADNPLISVSDHVDAVLYGLRLSDKFQDANGNPKIVQLVARKDGGDPELSVSKDKILARINALISQAGGSTSSARDNDSHDSDDDTDDDDYYYDDDDDDNDDDEDATPAPAPAPQSIIDALATIRNAVDSAATPANKALADSVAKDAVNAIRRFRDRL